MMNWTGNWQPGMRLMSSEQSPENYGIDATPCFCWTDSIHPVGEEKSMLNVEENELVYTGTSERHVLYPDPCEECGGTQWDIGGRSHYNGRYQCYTLYLECENCGVYDVECV